MKKSYRFMKTTRTVLSLTVVVATTATPVLAQDPVLAGQAVVQAQPVEGAAFGMVPGMAGPSKEKLGGAKQFQLVSIYAMEIRRLSATVKLEDAQKTKLTIGSKGLAKKKSQEFVKNMMGMAMGMPIGGAAPAAKPSNDEPEVKFTEVKSFSDIDENTRLMLDGGFSPESKPYDDADWLKLVKAVLKPEQYTQYEQTIAANKIKMDKAIADAGAAEISLELALSKDQESKLSALVLEQISKPKNVTGLAAQALLALQMEGKQFVVELAKVDSTKLRNILNPQQFEQVNLKLDVYKSILDQMNPDIPVEGKQ